MKTIHRTVFLLAAVGTLLLGQPSYATGGQPDVDEPEITEEESRSLADLIQPPLPSPAPRAVERKRVPVAPTARPVRKGPLLRKTIPSRTASVP